MQVQDRLTFYANPSRGSILREFSIPQDRLPRDQQLDLPEIQESFRVNFSEGALAASTEGSRNVLQTARPSDEGGAADLKLRSYLAIAAL
jgi:hypothetical protein